MPALLIRHTEIDFDRWKMVFEQDGDIRRSHGSRNELIFRSASDPDEVWIVLEWDDLFRARLFAKSDEFVDTMLRAGVTQKPEIWYLNDVAEYSTPGLTS